MMCCFKEPGIVLLDTSSISLVHEDSPATAETFWKSLLASTSSRIKVLIPIGVIRELIKHQDNTKRSASYRQACKSALEKIRALQASERITVYDDHMNLNVDDSEVFADRSFINIVNAYKTKYNIYIVTQDVDLMTGIWDTLGLDCLSGKTKDASGIKRQTFAMKDVRVLKVRQIRSESGSKNVCADTLIDFRPTQTIGQFAASEGLDLNRCLEVARKASDTPVDAQTIARPFLQRAITQELKGAQRQTTPSGSSDARPFARTNREAAPRVKPASSANPAKAANANMPSFIAFTGPFDRNRCIAVSRDGRETRVSLKTQIGAGGEGFVFSTDIADSLAKVFQPGNATKNKFDKITAIISGGFSKEGICFPTHLLLNERREFIGYVMPKARGEALSCLLNAQMIRLEFPYLQRVDLVRLCISILDQIEYLHANDILMCDINNENILFENILYVKPLLT